MVGIGGGLQTYHGVCANTFSISTCNCCAKFSVTYSMPSPGNPHSSENTRSSPRTPNTQNRKANALLIRAEPMQGKTTLNKAVRLAMIVRAKQTKNTEYCRQTNQTFHASVGEAGPLRRRPENKDRQKQIMKHIYHSQQQTNGSAITTSCTAPCTCYTCTTRLQRIKI